MNIEKVKKINKKTKKIAKKLEGVLFLKKGLFTISLSEDEIYTLLTENKIQIKEGDFQCTIE